jgi:hypothetical protein
VSQNDHGDEGRLPVLAPKRDDRLSRRCIVDIPDYLFLPVAKNNRIANMGAFRDAKVSLNEYYNPFGATLFWL